MLNTHLFCLANTNRREWVWGHFSEVRRRPGLILLLSPKPCWPNFRRFVFGDAVDDTFSYQMLKGNADHTPSVMDFRTRSRHDCDSDTTPSWDPDKPMRARLKGGPLHDGFIADVENWACKSECIANHRSIQTC
eukprot:5574462-Pyramimonas_sp.AAC.1